MSVNIYSKIKDILSELENLIGINQKEELKSVLINKGISVSDTDTISDMIEKLNSIIVAKGNAQPSDVLKNKTFSNNSNNNLVGTYVPPTLETLGGVKYASGSFDNVIGNDDLDNYFSTANIGFKPYIIRIRAFYNETGGRYIVLFATSKNADDEEVSESSPYYNNGRVHIIFLDDGFKIAQTGFQPNTFEYEAYGWSN